MSELVRAMLLALGATAAPPLALDTVREQLALSRAPDATVQEPATDAWIAQDKFRHFWMSYAVTAFGFAAARSVGQERDSALLIGISAAAIAGLGKELRDRRHGIGFSTRDLVADALGIAAAYFLLRESY